MHHTANAQIQNGFICWDVWCKDMHGKIQLGSCGCGEKEACKWDDSQSFVYFCGNLLLQKCEWETQKPLWNDCGDGICPVGMNKCKCEWRVCKNPVEP
jgi:hypothetical protein